MRGSAIWIGMLALFLASCGVEPQVRMTSKDELGKLKGPESTTIDQTLRAQADQAVAAGNYKLAAEIYKQLVDKSPDNKEYLLGLAEAMRRSGAFNASLQVTDLLLKKDPNNIGGLENKGLCLMGTGEFGEAGDTFGLVMKQDPKRWRTLNAIGILFAMKGKYDGAIAYYQEALNASTDNPSVLNNVALTYAISKDFKRAYETFERARRHAQPDSADLRHLDLNMALVYAVDGKLDSAERMASPHLSKEALYNNMGFYSYLAKNNDLAKGYLNMALTQSPVYYERAWKNLGALTGDASGFSGDGQPLPALMTQPAPSVASIQDTIPSSGGAHPAGIPLDDIPDSRAQHAAAQTVEPPAEEKKAPATLKSEEDKPAKNMPVKSAAAKDDIQVSVIPNAPDKDDDDGDKPKAPLKDLPNAAAQGDNPDVVLLRKPAPATNSDWDAVLAPSDKAQ